MWLEFLNVFLKRRISDILAKLYFETPSCMAQIVKNLPAMQVTQVGSLGQEDPLEREWKPTPVFLPGEFYGPRSLAGLSPWGHKELDRTEQLALLLSL